MKNHKNTYTLALLLTLALPCLAWGNFAEQAITAFEQGYAPSAHDEARIRAVLEKMQANHLIQEIRISQDATIKDSVMIALKIPYKGYALLIEYDFLASSRPEDEFAFLIGHEVTHIINGHLTRDVPPHDYNRIKRVQEHEADINSARTLKVAQAGINFFTSQLIGTDITLPNQNNMLLSYDGHDPDPDYTTDDTHPHHITRIKYLMPLALQQRAALA